MDSPDARSGLPICPASPNILFLASLIILGLFPTAWAGWVQDGGSLNINTNFSISQPHIAVNLTTPYVAWMEYDAFSRYQVYVKHFSGSQWIQDGSSLIIGAFQSANGVDLAFGNGTPYVAWNETAVGLGMQLYVKHYNGSDWQQVGSALNLNANRDANLNRLAFASTTPLVAWYESNGATFQVYVKCYNGISWVQVGGSLNVNSALNASAPDLAISQTTPYVIWTELNAAATSYLAYVKHFNGSSWQPDGGILNLDVNTSVWWPSLDTWNGTPYITWGEFATSNFQIYVQQYNGSAWSLTGGSLNIDPAQAAWVPKLRFFNATPFVVWQETNASGVFQTVVKYYSSSWVQLGNSINVNSALNAQQPALAFSLSTPYVAWTEPSALVNQVYVKHYEEPTTPADTATVTATQTVTFTPQSGFQSFFRIRHSVIRPTRGERAQMVFTLTQPSRARLTVYDLAGRRVAKPVDGVFSAGTHPLAWDGGNLGTGTYFVAFEAGDLRGRGKVVIIR